MKILVVEDDEFVSQALTAVLTNQNYTVEVASDGIAAWDLIGAFDYDLILLDVMLPKLDGISLCRQIRSKNLHTPILLLTGCDSSHDKAVGLDAGADDYLVKPFDAEELVARVRALLRRGRVTSQPVLRWDDLQLDPISCEVTYGTHLLALTPKEYALMELFLRNNRRVFSCSMILEHIWTYEDTPGEEAVRTHIKGLRQKLKAVGAPSDLIETVYGIGYRLKPQEGGVKRAGGAGEAGEAGGEIAIPNQKFKEQTLTAVAGVWQRFKARIDEQVALLEQAASALNRNSLNQELHTKAAAQAHTLAGSLGTFGFALGSKLARQIEHLLTAQTLAPAEAKQFSDLVQALRQEIEQPQDVADERPLLLVVDSDRATTQELITASAQWGLKVAVSTSIEAAKTSLAQARPSVVLLDPQSDQADSISFLSQLRQYQPPVPVIVFTSQTDLNNRLEIARNGGRIFLHKPMQIAQVLETVTQVLARLEPAAAKILVVDDDPQILTILQTLLEPWGLKVIPLSDPERFWETLEAVKPDLLILDVEMPKVSGIELCQVVRNDPHWSELPILFLTVHNDAQMVNRVFAIGADDFVNKPIVGPELVTRIINRLERLKLRQRIAQKHIDTVDSKQRISLFNSGAEKIFGYTAPEMLKQVERMKDEFVSVVSHELRTPLTSIHGSLRMLSSSLIQPESEQGKRLVQIATDSCDRLVRLINDILDIERIESGRVTMKKQTCNVTDLIAKAVNVMQPLADRAGVTISVSSLSVQLWADADRIVQTLTNLLSNAIKFSPSGSTIWLSAEIKAGEDREKTTPTPSTLFTPPALEAAPPAPPAANTKEILFTVKDQGRGIPADKLGTIFERFQQVDSTDSRNHDGTGLGLAICRSIVQQHGGRIWVETDLGEGSTFYFTLPTTPSPHLPISPSVPLVLFGNDHPTIRTGLQTLLEQHYRVESVT